MPKMTDNNGITAITCATILIAIAVLLSLLCGCSAPLQPRELSPAEQLERDLVGCWVLYSTILDNNVWVVIRLQMDLKENHSFTRQVTLKTSGLFKMEDGGRWYVDKDVPMDNGYLLAELIFDWATPLSSYYGNSYRYWTKVSPDGKRLSMGSDVYDKVGTGE